MKTTKSKFKELLRLDDNIDILEFLATHIEKLDEEEVKKFTWLTKGFLAAQ